MIVKSFDGHKIDLQKVSLDWKGVKLFIEKIFKETIGLDAQHKELTSQNTKKLGPIVYPSPTA